MGINKESGRVEFGIKVLDSTKCYYCGRKGKEISDILKKMSNEIDHGINAIKEEMNGLDNYYSKEEKKIKGDLKGIDLSYKIETCMTDYERFKEMIPHLDVLRSASDAQRAEEIQKKRGSFNHNKWNRTVTLQSAVDYLGAYFESQKAVHKNGLEKQLRESEIIKVKYDDHKLRPLVNMASKPLGQNTPSMKRELNGLPPIIPPVLEIQSRIRYDMKSRTDEVKFTLSTCHFCYDRFQGSTL